MIARVFREHIETKTRKVKKEIVETVTETIYESVTRSVRVVEPPTTVTHCLHCKIELKSSMWAGGKSGKYLCPTCWYRRTTASEKEKYRLLAQKMSTGGVSYKTVTDQVPKKVEKKFTKSIEIDEQYDVSELRLASIPPIPYPKLNKKIIIDIPDIVSLQKQGEENAIFFKEVDLARDFWWFHAASHDEAFQQINQLSKHEKIKIQTLGPIEYNEMIVDEKQVVDEFPDVVGFYPNVPAFIQGHPLNMYNNRRRNVVNIDKSVTIFMNMAMDSEFNESQYKNRGIICFSLIDYLKYNNIKVNLKILEASYIDGESLFQVIDFKYPTLKESMTLVYNLLTSISFLRIVLLEHKAHLVRTKKISEKWLDGFGYCTRASEIKKELDLNENDIVIGTPEEMNIGGLFLDDDFASCMEILNLYNEVNEVVDETEPESLSVAPVQGVILRRNIQKIIHVTASENVKSIQEKGILPNDVLLSQKIVFHRNDPLRLDKHTDAICLSIEQPNEYLFNEFIKRNPNTEYKVIEISPKILYELESNGKPVERIYSDYNAASRFSKKSKDNIEIMYKDCIRRRAKTHTRVGKKDSEPTSFQAEILFFGAIPPQYILNIYDYKRTDNG